MNFPKDEVMYRIRRIKTEHEGFVAEYVEEERQRVDQSRGC